MPDSIPGSPTLTELIDALQSASARYREHASRDASWVQTWTGQADPELLEIEALMEAVVSHDTSANQIVGLLDRLCAVQEEPIVAQALTEALLAAPRDALREAMVERAVEVVQELHHGPPAATPWLAQALFWSASEFDDLELCVALVGGAERLCRGVPIWLATPRALDREHLFATSPGEAVVWIQDVADQMRDVGSGAEVWQGVALMWGMTRSGLASPGLAQILSARLSEVSSPQALVEPDVAITASLEALGVLPERLDDEALLGAVLASPAHGDRCAEWLASDGVIRVPMLSALLTQTREQPDQSALRIRACRALRQMEQPTPEADEVLLALTRDPMTPLRHMALYALVERGFDGIIDRIEAMIRSETDCLEAEELLFILASHPSDSAEKLIMALMDTPLPSNVDVALCEEALMTWRAQGA